MHDWMPPPPFFPPSIYWMTQRNMAESQNKEFHKEFRVRLNKNT